MARNVTLFTGQWADLPLAELAPMAKSFGYDGLELACWGDHFEVEKAAESKAYCDDKRALLEKHGLGVWAVSNHLAGQLVCDPNDKRSAGFVADESMQGSPEDIRAWGIDQMKKTAKAAKNLGVNVVNGFTGSSIWHAFYSFPPWTDDMVADGYKDFAAKWIPILDVFVENDVKFGLEVHPTEIAYDTYTALAAVEAVDGHPAFGINFDPSHLVWQMVDSADFVRSLGDRIFHVHMKDSRVSPDGKGSILGSHLDFGDHRRAWDFVSVGRGSVDFEAIIRALNDINYQGPLSVEWEDSGMDREHGAAEAAAFCKKVDFKPSEIVFDAQFSKD
jgi:sugar phosphate isomerase/epimerase